MSDNWQAWEIVCCGITSIVIAQTRGRARYLTMRAAVESGYAKTIKDSLPGLKSRRARRYDIDARELAKEALRSVESLPLRRDLTAVPSRCKGRGYFIQPADPTVWDVDSVRVDCQGCEDCFSEKS